MPKDEDCPGMLGVMSGVVAQRWPHTIDAHIWAKEWMKIITIHPEMAQDEEAMIGWFANAIMAGYDTAAFRIGKLAGRR